MNSQSRKTSELRQLMKERRFVRFRRTFEQGFVRGLVMEVGPKFFLLALQSDGIRFDGFASFRITDVRNLRRDPFEAFTRAALKKLGEPIPKKPKVSVTNIDELLLSASKSFSLVTIHREKTRPDSCWIGMLKEISRKEVSLLEIGPDAKWDPKPTLHKLNEITAVEFGGEYERALILVGGKPM